MSQSKGWDGENFKMPAVGYLGIITVTDGASPTVNSLLGNIFYLASTQNPTVTISNSPPTGFSQVIYLIFKAVTSARTLAFDSSVAFTEDIAALSQTTASKYDTVKLLWIPALSKWSVNGYSKGAA